MEVVTEESQQTITADIMGVEERELCLPALFSPRRMVMGEQMIFRMAELLSPEYRGGYWEMVKLGNGGMFMYPTNARSFLIDSEITCYRGHASDEAFGIICCLFALSSMCQRAYDEGDVMMETADQMSDMYHALRYYASEHKDAQVIFQAID